MALRCSKRGDTKHTLDFGESSVCVRARARVCDMVTRWNVKCKSAHVCSTELFMDGVCSVCLRLSLVCARVCVCVCVCVGYEHDVMGARARVCV